MTLPPFHLDRPSSVADALQRRSEGAAAYGGGTELLLAMRIGLLRPDVLTDLKRLPELRGITVENDALSIGAACTHDEVSRDALVREHLPILSRVASKVGNPRVRAQGTIGGNIVFAEPKSDIVPLLIALDGMLTLQSPAGSREVTPQEFMVGPYWTEIGDDEILTRITVPLVEGRQASYEKFQTLGRPSIGVAVRTDRSGATRLVVGSVCELPHVVDVAAVSEVDAEGIAAEVDVTADLTGDVEYKRSVTAVIIRRAVDALGGSTNGA